MSRPGNLTHDRNEPQAANCRGSSRRLRASADTQRRVNKQEKVPEVVTEEVQAARQAISSAIFFVLLSFSECDRLHTEQFVWQRCESLK